MINLIRDRYESVLDKIAKHAKYPDRVTVIAISKKQPIEKIEQAYHVGIRNFGENYVQEAIPKIESVRSLPEINWHFVGKLQTNKMNKIVPSVQFIHSIDQWSQIERLQKWSDIENPPLLFIQLNLAEENTKGGLIEHEVERFCREISEKTIVKISGFMTFPPYQEDVEINRKYFVRARNLQIKINQLNLARIQIQELSMGVSNDFHIALEEGSTMIRVGEALFGPRT